MFPFAPYIVKGLWRHRARTLLTVSGTAVALLVFCFIGAVQQGLLALTSDKEAGRTLIVFQENRFCPQSSRLPQDYGSTISRMPGVNDVVPIKVFTNNCRASLDSIVFQGMPAAQLKQWRKLTLTSGDYASFERQDDGALVGQAVASRRGLSTGDKFTIGDVSVVVTGIFSSDVSAEDNLVLTHLEFLQRTRGANEAGTVTMLEVRLNDNADPDKVATSIDEEFHSGPVATTTRTKGMFQADTISDLAELIGFVHWLGYACVGLVLSLVATTTVMAVQDRIKEHAVLQTLGVRPLRVFRFVLAESFLLTMLGGIVGVLGSMVFLSTTGMAVAAEGVTITFRPSWSLVVQGLTIAAIVGLIAGLAPGWQASKAQIVSALKQA